MNLITKQRLADFMKEILAAMGKNGGRDPAWKTPWTEEPGGLLSMGSHRVGHDCSDLAAAAAAHT